MLEAVYCFNIFFAKGLIGLIFLYTIVVFHLKALLGHIEILKIFVDLGWRGKHLFDLVAEGAFAVTAEALIVTIALVSKDLVAEVDVLLLGLEKLH